MGSLSVDPRGRNTAGTLLLILLITSLGCSLRNTLLEPESYKKKYEATKENDSLRTIRYHTVLVAKLPVFPASRSAAVDIKLSHREHVTV